MQSSKLLGHKSVNQRWVISKNQHFLNRNENCKVSIYLGTVLKALFNFFDKIMKFRCCFSNENKKTLVSFVICLFVYLFVHMRKFHNLLIK